MKQLLKTLYGLKQGRKNWYEMLCRALLELGFKKKEADHAVFFKEIVDDIIVLGVHVDNYMITGSSTKNISDYECQV